MSRKRKFRKQKDPSFNVPIVFLSKKTKKQKKKNGHLKTEDYGRHSKISPHPNGIQENTRDEEFNGQNQSLKIVENKIPFFFFFYDVAFPFYVFLSQTRKGRDEQFLLCHLLSRAAAVAVTAAAVAAVVVLNRHRLKMKATASMEETTTIRR
jgi:hypothetical protein